MADRFLDEEEESEKRLSSVVRVRTKVKCLELVAHAANTFVMIQDAKVC